MSSMREIMTPMARELPTAPALEEATAQRWTRPMRGRELAWRAGFSAVVLVAAVLLAVFGDRQGMEVQPGRAVALVLLLSALTAIEFPVGTGVVTPATLAFVPALFLLPAAVVPLAAVVAGIVGMGYSVARSAGHPSRMAIAPSAGAFALAPAVLLLWLRTVVALDEPSWRWLAVGLLLLPAQVLVDFVLAVVTYRLACGFPLMGDLGAWSVVGAIDGLLWPVGCALALASAVVSYAFLAALPLVLLLHLLARERDARVRAEIERLRIGRSLDAESLLEALEQ
jgi:hypothetical protein